MKLKATIAITLLATAAQSAMAGTCVKDIGQYTMRVEEQCAPGADFLVAWPQLDQSEMRRARSYIARGLTEAGERSKNEPNFTFGFIHSGKLLNADLFIGVRQRFTDRIGVTRTCRTLYQVVTLDGTIVATSHSMACTEGEGWVTSG